jgi:hypothetical protein
MVDAGGPESAPWSRARARPKDHKICNATLRARFEELIGQGMSQIQAARQMEKDQKEKWGTVLFPAQALRIRYHGLSPGRTIIVRDKKSGRFVSAPCSSRTKSAEIPPARTRHALRDDKGRFVPGGHPSAKPEEFTPGRERSAKLPKGGQGVRMENQDGVRWE